MAAGSVAVMLKNLKQAPQGFAALASGFGENFATWRKIKDRQWEFGPQSVKDQAEVYDETYWKRHLCQRKNMWVDRELSTVMTRQDVAKLQVAKMDGWRTLHWGAPLLIAGPWALPLYPVFFGNDTFQPSTMPQTPEALAEWRQAQDLQRYKHAPAMLTNFKWFLDVHIKLPDAMWPLWEELFEKNDVRRCPKNIQSIDKWYEMFQPFYLVRRQQARAIGRCMGIPTYPTFGKICLQTRIKDYWELAWNEDYMVIKAEAHKTMSDAELHDYAWRRYLAPYDKDLTRDQIMQRVEDYHTFLGEKFVSEAQAPNIFLTISYVMGYYNDPAYLEMDIKDLEENDFAHLADLPKDAFMQRLEFENGPLRHQVEAHSQKVLAERQAKLKALEESS